MSKKFRNLCLGVGIGVGLGMLFAPKKGEELRKDLKVKIDDLVNFLKENDADDMKELLIVKLNNIKKSLEDVTSEEILEDARKKSIAIKKDLDELVKTAKKKSSPYVTKACNVVKDKTVLLLNDTLEKLETK